MKKIVAVGLLALSANAVQANETNSLFNCVDKESLDINHACIQNQMGQDIEFEFNQNTLASANDAFGDKVMATMRYFPELQLIEVVAHRDALENAQLTAKID